MGYKEDLSITTHIWRALATLATARRNMDKKNYRAKKITNIQNVFCNKMIIFNQYTEDLEELLF